MLTRIFPNEYLATTALVAVLVSIVSLGCEQERSWKQPGPEASFENFLMDWYRGEYDRAFGTIVAEDRERLTAPLADLEGKVDKKNLPEESEMLVVGRVDNPYDIKDIELDEPLESEPDKGQKVNLVLKYHDGRTGSATVVWGGEKWFVDLPLADQEVEQEDEKPAAAPKTPEQDADQQDADQQDADQQDAGQPDGGTQDVQRQKNEER